MVRTSFTRQVSPTTRSRSRHSREYYRASITTSPFFFRIEICPFSFSMDKPARSMRLSEMRLSRAFSAYYVANTLRVTTRSARPFTLTRKLTVPVPLTSSCGPPSLMPQISLLVARNIVNTNQICNDPPSRIHPNAECNDVW